MPRFDVERTKLLMYRHLYSRIVYPLYHWLIGSGALSAVRELDSHDNLTNDEMHELEQNKLRCLLARAHRYVPYYREIIDQTGLDTDSLAESQHFRSLPLLSKSIIRRQGERLHSAMLGGNRLDPNSTSGSTGSPLHFFTDRRSKSFRKAVVIRNRKWLGIRVGDPVVHIWGSPIDQKRAEALRGRIHARITRETLLSAYAIGDDGFAEYAKVLRQSGARLLIGYPSVLSEFARFCGNRSVRFPRLQAIISSAEALYEIHRQVIEDNFNVPLFNRYGCREVGDIAHEVPEQEGLIVNSDRVLVEVIDDFGESCSPGVLGRLIVTDLDNFGMPIIRYDSGDLGSWACGNKHGRSLPYPVLESVEGRSLDVVSSPSGARVGGTFWTILFRERPGIAMFQVTQDRPDGVQVRFVRDVTVDQIDFNYFSRKIKSLCGSDFAVAYKEVKRIDPEPNGKYRVVISCLGTSSANCGDQ